MRKLMLVLLLCPSLAFAQLDRLRGDMSEADFQLKFPEAKRDFEKDAGWIELADSVHGTTGRSSWRIYNDTVVVHRFTSGRVEGPSDKFPKFDSTGVHKLRESADALRRKLELSLGKPNKLYNVSFIAPNPMGTGIFYFAEWNFPDNGIVRITVMKEVPQSDKTPPSGYAHIAKPTNAQTYQLTLNIDHRNLFTSGTFSIGKSATEFFIKYPNLKVQGGFVDLHTYVIYDSLLSNDAVWIFWFRKGKFGRMEFTAPIGKKHGATSAKAIYPLVYQRTNDLLAQGNQSFGQPDSLYNVMPKEFPQHDANTYYENQLVYCRWTGEHEKVLLFVKERAGENNEGTFWMAVYFNRP